MSAPRGHRPDEEGAITLDMMLYGNAYVREPIPEWWGCLHQIITKDIAQLAQPMSDDEHRIIEGRPR